MKLIGSGVANQDEEDGERPQIKHTIEPTTLIDAIKIDGLNGGAGATQLLFGGYGSASLFLN